MPGPLSAPRPVPSPLRHAIHPTRSMMKDAKDAKGDGRERAVQTIKGLWKNSNDPNRALGVMLREVTGQLRLKGMFIRDIELFHESISKKYD